MGKYFRKCKGIGEIAVMEVSPVGVRTRARSLALALSSAGKRKRTLSGDFRSRRIPAQARNSPDSVQIPTDRSPSPDPVLTSRCSSNGSSELVQERLRSEHLAVSFKIQTKFNSIPFIETIRFLNLMWFL